MEIVDRWVSARRASSASVIFSSMSFFLAGCIGLLLLREPISVKPLDRIVLAALTSIAGGHTTWTKSTAKTATGLDRLAAIWVQTQGSPFARPAAVTGTDGSGALIAGTGSQSRPG